MDLKRVLITGKNSYVGTNVEKWLMKESDKYYVESISVRDDSWKNFDFSKFDVVFHVAGIAHVSAKKNLDDFYYKINRDLAIDVAKHSKKSGIKHFIFMSSMIIYGKDNNSNDFNHIDITSFSPINAYGKSKLEADLKIQLLSNNEFKTSIIRTPVIYGPKCKGNFHKLQKLAKWLIIVPDIRNQRSMIYIENFAEFVKKIIDFKEYGIFYPQSTKYFQTSEILKITRNALGKKTICIKLFNPFIELLTKKTNFFKKIYGNKTYDLTLNNNDKLKYNLVDVEESIMRSLT
jgi:nucleoside-diphosphate-sugar epimerase